MKKLFVLPFLMVSVFQVFARQQPIQPALIPVPVKATYGQGFSVISKQTAIDAGSELKYEAALLNELIKRNLGYTLPVIEHTNRMSVKLRIDTLLVKEPEGYLLESNGNLNITAHDGAGLIHGIQTLRQLWVLQEGTLKIPVANIQDYPRFSYRGMHLDVCRHFFSLDFIKQYIDLLSLYKFNTFHWHLTDDQGWRIEIKKYPKLQTVAAWRDETMIGHKKELPHSFDGKRYGGYYTQEQIKEIVQYATERHITVIPEIEMPGHAQAALAAYPALGCTGGPYKTATFWGIFDEVFCAGKDSTFTFLQDVLDEVLTLFPSQYIHIGGDECPKTRWKACPHCQKRIKEENLSNEDELQSYFVGRIAKYVQSKGRRVIGWDEILEGGLAKGATVMSWRGTGGAVEAARMNHDAIMTTEDEYYFDHYQSLYPSEPVAAGGYTSLKDVYNYQPLPDSIDASLLPHIKGVQGQLWSEYLPTAQQASYMLLPRAIALAEAGWSQSANLNYDDFLLRVRKQDATLKRIGLTMANNFDEITFTTDKVLRGSLSFHLHSSFREAEIRYTSDGSFPDKSSRVYSGLVQTGGRNGVIRAQLFRNGMPWGRIFELPYSINKATGADITVSGLPAGTSASRLMNGLSGTHRYNDNQWVRFTNNFEAILDLGSSQSISKFGANVLNYAWQRMWPPVSLDFYVSDNGTDYTKITSLASFPVNGINKARATVKPVNARYVKISGRHPGIIPAGKYGAGSTALMMIDEFILE
ncbi:family 20 glycosylhydrolase [Pseudobacter ginsenosidimutans]|uniref:beta-N-acetylhexosaminidase n=1 Tax=Pseudobacter ginsenosidimutans TaxID=661488 RepID=A0A4Q7MSE7_9BACT|nr:family 20 glycosylhydrolase [Pseudobacter ginsenosidimutans]QEC41482.1 family 20 glycosylhydrolase [Pseudobacter ginsenosidimutans]RZS71736.1 hexosaminidase [Pseudobacter ginsenosidimutans]